MKLYRFIEAEKAHYSVSLLTRVLGVARSGYYAWRGRKPSGRTAANAELVGRIRQIHTRSRGTYGYLRVHAQLQCREVVGRNRVARLMRLEGLRGCGPKRKLFTTRRDNNRACSRPGGEALPRSCPRQALGGRHHLLSKAGCTLPLCWMPTVAESWAGQ